LKIHTLPKSGGDTLWASAYEAYDRLSPPYQKFLEGLTAVHDAKYFATIADRFGKPLRTGERGAPDNVGGDLVAVHSVIRTNPVTGWKGVFVNAGYLPRARCWFRFTKRIVELTKDESDLHLDYLFKLIPLNHDLQVRFKWNKNDVAIWDNRSTYHSATYDIGNEVRVGDRVVSLGETPYFDPNSKSRREALGTK
jgi:alpha-ketoglutarate-dependent taurine dioxygenase